MDEVTLCSNSLQRVLIKCHRIYATITSVYLAFDQLRIDAYWDMVICVEHIVFSASRYYGALSSTINQYSADSERHK